MNRFLINYAWEICELSKAQNVDMSTAPLMFCENLETYVEGEPVHYAGADVDYAVASAQWKAFTDEEKANAKIAFNNMWRDNRKELGETRRVGSRAKFEDIVMHWDRDIEPKEPDYVLYRASYQIFDNAVKGGIDIISARDEYVAYLESEENTQKDARVWKEYDDAKRQEEKDWFERNVTLYDKGLMYAYETKDRPLFRSILCDRNH